MSTISNDATQKIRGNLAYKERQQIRKSYLERKQKLRRIFEMGKVVEKAGFEFEDLDAIYRILVEARKNYSSSFLQLGNRGNLDYP